MNNTNISGEFSTCAIFDFLIILNEINWNEINMSKWVFNATCLLGLQLIAFTIIVVLTKVSQLENSSLSNTIFITAFIKELSFIQGFWKKGESKLLIKCFPYISPQLLFFYTFQDINQTNWETCKACLYVSYNGVIISLSNVFVGLSLLNLRISINDGPTRWLLDLEITE